MLARHPYRRLVVATGSAAAILALAACGSSSDPAATTSAAVTDTASDTASASASAGEVMKDDALAALVPAKIAADGKITVGSDASYAPNEFIDTDGSTVVGFDVDLGKAVGKVLGLEMDFQNAPFDAIIPGLDSGKYELGISSFTINPERLKIVDMVSYYQAGTAWATAAGNPNGVAQDDACGKKVAVQKATVQVDDITAKDAACKKAGKPGIAISQFQAQSDATTALVSGRVDAMLADSPIVAYAIQQTGDKLEQLGEISDAAPYGAAVPKTQPDLAKAIQGAYQKLMDDGGYTAVLDTWGVTAGAIDKSEINPAVQ